MQFFRIYLLDDSGFVTIPAYNLKNEPYTVEAIIKAVKHRLTRIVEYGELTGVEDEINFVRYVDGFLYFM